MATRAWSNLIGTLTFQRYVPKKPRVSPDPSSSREGAGHETNPCPTNVVSFINTLVEYHLWVAMNLLLHPAMLDLMLYQHNKVKIDIAGTGKIATALHVCPSPFGGITSRKLTRNVF